MDNYKETTGRGGKPPVAPRSELFHKDGIDANPQKDRVTSSTERIPRTDASGSSGGSSNRSTPRSVVVGSVALSRDLSDLSGSYYHGISAGASSQAIPRQIYNDDGSSVSSLQKSWRQAYILSNNGPDLLVNEQSLVGGTLKPLVCMDENDSVELVRKATNVPALFDSPDSPRIPLLVMIMDASRKVYELLRIYVDADTDNVRDVLHSVRQHIPDYWKQDYDGLIQIRSGVSSQLIHCLSLQHYDVQPFECWIAKPWSVSAKSAGHLGESLIMHLNHVGVLVENGNLGEGECFVQLSEAAAARLYEPHGTFDHYHAKDYLTFSPPFECNRWKHRAASDDQSNRSGHTSRSRGSSLAVKLGSLHEGDELEILEESHEVQTVSSYSHLAAVKIFDSILENNDDSSQEIPPTASISALRFELEATACQQHDEKASSLKRKGIVGKLWCRSPSSSCRSDGSQDSLLVHTGVQVSSWDLTPMNSNCSVASFGTSREDASHYSSHQPLLKSCASGGVIRSSRYRRI